MSFETLRTRHSLQHIQHLYDSGEDRSQLENLIRAFRGIQALPPDDPNSFFHLSSLHGLPFRGPGVKNPEWWGGYCWHFTVLFPTWHRIYVLFLENALRSIPGCQDVTLPFWDEIANLDHVEAASVPVIPSVLTSPTFELDGRSDNPLHSYKLQKALVEITDRANHRYSKPAEYETVRYPLSGLVGTEADRTATLIHNEKFPNQAQNIQTLNNNVTEWLLGTVKIPNDSKNTLRPDTYSVLARYLRCLLAPNYTVFSNVSSQNQWIKDHGQERSSHYVVALESPHNAIHLALGGFYQEGVYNADPIRGANGDMGDNETAGFDPIFFFHHCFIDYTFSMWQRLWGHTKRGSLTLIDIKNYPGTVLEYGQPPNFPPSTVLTMTTPLYPFKKPGEDDSHYTSEDATDNNELGIAYGPGSFDPLIPAGIDPARSHKSPFEIISPQVPDPMKLEGSNPNVTSPFSLIKRVHNISRTQYEGSFIIRLYAVGHDGQEVEVGREPVLSRWNAKGCLNCQSHLDVNLYVPIDPETLKLLEGPAGPGGEKAEIGWKVKVHTRDGMRDLPIAAPGQDRGGEPDDRPKVDDL